MTARNDEPPERALPVRLAGQPWLASAQTQAVMRALADGGYEARAVGGAVRNSLMGHPVKDVDIATTALPDVVADLAIRAGLKAVPTGLEHGTITVIAGHTPFEVTTLRRDIETFGRHARVTYTTDWSQDAARRDFTINALYAAADGRIYDPIGGYPDIVARRVRFIGDPHDRIREDYLRILRFFRFTADYAGGAPDAAGLAACRELAGGLDRLSRERIRAELLRLLEAPGAVTMLEAMHEAGILAHVLPHGPSVETCARLVRIQAHLGQIGDAILRLAALALHQPGDAFALRDRLRLSASEYERLAHMSLPDPAFDPETDECQAKAYLYRHGAQAYRDGVLLSWARSDDPPEDPRRAQRLMLPSRWTPPEFPVRGADVLALGVPAGPAVGKVLAALEEWWIKMGYPADSARLAAELQRLCLVTKA